jgi:hypothetical protein
MATVYKTNDAKKPAPANVQPTGIVAKGLSYTVATGGLISPEADDSLELMKIPAGAEIIRCTFEIPKPTTNPTSTTAAIQFLYDDGTTADVVAATSLNTAALNPLHVDDDDTVTSVYSKGDAVLRILFDGGSSSAFANAQVIKGVVEYTLQDSERFTPIASRTA